MNNISVNFTEWNPENATNMWLNNASNTGTFTAPQVTLDNAPEGISGIPTGWTKNVK